MAPKSSQWGRGFPWTLTFTSEVLLCHWGTCLAGLLVPGPRYSLLACQCPSELSMPSPGLRARARWLRAWAFAQMVLGKRR